MLKCWFLDKESVSAVKRQWLQCGPYDGLLGFSQGAAFAAMLCCMQHSGALQTYFRWSMSPATCSTLVPCTHPSGEAWALLNAALWGPAHILQVMHEPCCIRHSGPCTYPSGDVWTLHTSFRWCMSPATCGTLGPCTYPSGEAWALLHAARWHNDIYNITTYLRARALESFDCKIKIP